MRSSVLFLTVSLSLFASSDATKQASEFYQRTDYKQSLQILESIPFPNAGVYSLIGRNYLMTGDFKKASEAIQKAVDLEPDNSDYNLWLGRAWGRRAETSSLLTAPIAASKARQFFEKSVALDPNNIEAINDLFDYYLEAPGFLGGGMDKAADLAKRIARINPAEYHFAEAQLADRRKEYDTAEQHFRRAIQLAPRQVGRVIDLARYLARQGRTEESEAVFAQAEKMEPDSPKVLFWHAKTYVQERRNLDKAQELLKRYLRSNLTPDDPPREEAKRLLKKAVGA